MKNPLTVAIYNIFQNNNFNNNQLILSKLNNKSNLLFKMNQSYILLNSYLSFKSYFKSCFDRNIAKTVPSCINIKTWTIQPLKATQLKFAITVNITMRADLKQKWRKKSNT